MSQGAPERARRLTEGARSKLGYAPRPGCPPSQLIPSLGSRGSDRIGARTAGPNGRSVAVHGTSKTGSSAHGPRGVSLGARILREPRKVKAGSTVPASKVRDAEAAVGARREGGATDGRRAEPAGPVSSHRERPGSDIRSAVGRLPGVPPPDRARSLDSRAEPAATRGQASASLTAPSPTAARGSGLFLRPASTALQKPVVTMVERGDEPRRRLLDDLDPLEVFAERREHGPAAGLRL